MESEIEKGRKESVKIAVCRKRCIRSNDVGDNLHSSYFALKYGLEMSI